MRKVTFPGLIITCNNCKAKLGISSMFTAGGLILFVAGIALIKLYSGSFLYWLGWLVLMLSSVYHLSQVPLKIRNKGPNHDQYRS